MRNSRTLYYSGAGGSAVSTYDVPGDQTLESIDWTITVQSGAGISAHATATLGYNPTTTIAESDQANQNLSACGAAVQGFTAIAGFGKFSLTDVIPGGFKLLAGDRLYVNTSQTAANVIVVCVLRFK